jgi:dihydrofolate synthase/folylpolyglutamate synthase
MFKSQYTLSLFGVFQGYNFLCAYEVFRLLKISEDEIKFAATNTYHRGRLDVISTNPLILADATHNEAGAKVLYETLSQNYQPQDIIIVTSILKDKNICGILDYFTRLSDTIIFVSVANTDRGLLAKELFNIAKTCHLPNNIQLYSVDKIHQALDYAKTFNRKLILITGSLYLLQELNQNKP